MFATLQQIDHLHPQLNAKHPMVLPVQIPQRVPHRFIRLDVLHLRRQRRQERPSRSEDCVRGVLGISVSDSVEHNNERLGGGRLYVSRQVSEWDNPVNDMRCTEGLEVGSVAEGGGGDDGREPGELSELNHCMRVDSVRWYRRVNEVGGRLTGLTHGGSTSHD